MISDRDKDELEQTSVAVDVPSNLTDQLYAEYGSDLEEPDLCEQQQKDLLLTYWRIMVLFVDVGFSVKPGDKITPDADLSLDDVLSYITLETTAHETVAPPNANPEEQS